MKKAETIISSVIIFSFLTALVLNSCKKKDENIFEQECEPPKSPSATNNSPLAIGDTVRLQAEIISGATYSWTGPDGFTSSSQNPEFILKKTSNAGEYKVTATVNGCTSNPYYTYVNLCRTRAMSNSQIPYQDTFKVRLSALDILDAYGQKVPSTYYWSGPNGFTSNKQNPIISSPPVEATGTYSVHAITSSGKVTPVSTTTVLVQPKAINFTANTAIVGGNLNLTATSVSGATYSWSGPNGFTSTVQNPVISNVTRKAIGMYTLTYFISGVQSAAKTKYVYVNFSNSGCGGQTNLTINGLVYNLQEVGGTQCWMKSDLKRSGTAPGNPYHYRYLSAKPAADTQGVCPAGWHIPTPSDWQNLALSVGHDGNALKELGQGSGAGAGTNTSSFSSIFRVGNDAKYWSSSASSNTAIIMKLYKTNSNIMYDQVNQSTDSAMVRCIKD